MPNPDQLGPADASPFLMDLCNKVPAQDDAGAESVKLEPRRRASVVELRKAMVMARAFADAGILFVPVPVIDVEHYASLVADVAIIMDTMAAEETLVEKQQQADAPRILLL